MYVVNSNLQIICDRLEKIQSSLRIAREGGALMFLTLFLSVELKKKWQLFFLRICRWKARTFPLMYYSNRHLFLILPSSSIHAEWFWLFSRSDWYALSSRLHIAKSSEASLSSCIIICMHLLKKCMFKCITLFPFFGLMTRCVCGIWLRLPFLARAMQLSFAVSFFSTYTTATSI